MKMTEKWKGRKNHKEDNTDKKVKEKKSVKRKIEEPLNKKYLRNGSYSTLVISAVFVGNRGSDQHDRRSTANQVLLQIRY